MKNYRQCIQNGDSENSLLNLHPVHNTYLFTITVHKYVFMWTPASWICHPVVLQEMTDVSNGSTASTFRAEAENRKKSYSSVLQMEAKGSSDTCTKLYRVTSQYTGIFLLTTTKPQTSLVLISHLPQLCLFNPLCIWELQIILISMMYRTILTCTTADTDYSVT